MPVPTGPGADVRPRRGLRGRKVTPLRLEQDALIIDRESLLIAPCFVAQALCAQHDTFVMCSLQPEAGRPKGVPSRQTEDTSRPTSPVPATQASATVMRSKVGSTSLDGEDARSNEQEVA
jgi:hypothetical protein